jgi:hypothetical protein
MNKKTTARKTTSNKVLAKFDIVKVSNSVVAERTNKNVAGLKKAKDLANKAMVTVETIKKPVAKKTTSKKSISKVASVAKKTIAAKKVTSAIVQPTTLSKDPGDISAATARDTIPTPVFDPRKKVSFIQPVTLSGKPLALKQFQN